MTAPLPDDDLLALIEGELAPERIERIRTVLLRDPALMRKLEAMQRDRALVKRVEQGWAAQPRLLDPRLISDAIDQAEREALLHEGAARRPDVPRRRPSRKRLGRRITMVASLVLGAGLLATWSWLLIGRTKPSAEVQVATKIPPTAPPQTLALGPTETAELAGPPAIAEAATEIDRLAVEIESPTDEDLTEAWLRSAGMTPAQDSPSPDAPPAMASGLSLQDAARLAMEGRLRLVTDRPPGNVVRAMANDVRNAGPLAGPGLDLGALGTPASPREITLRVAPSPEAQKELEHQLARAVQQMAVASGASIRFAAIDRPAAPPAPSMTFDDILWWSRPAAEWRPRVEIRIPVELAPNAPATP